MLLPFPPMSNATEYQRAHGKILLALIDIQRAWLKFWIAGAEARNQLFGLEWP